MVLFFVREKYSSAARIMSEQIRVRCAHGSMLANAAMNTAESIKVLKVRRKNVWVLEVDPDGGGMQGNFNVSQGNRQHEKGKDVDSGVCGEGIGIHTDFRIDRVGAQRNARIFCGT